MPSRSKRARLWIPALVILTAALSACGGVTPAPPQTTETKIVSYTFTPPSPATLKMGEDVIVNLSFVTSSVVPIRMWARIEYDGPITEGTLSYCPSPVITAKDGVIERCFSVTDASINGVPVPLHVDTIELSIADPDQTKELFQEFVTVDYTWEP